MDDKEIKKGSEMKTLWKAEMIVTQDIKQS